MTDVPGTGAASDKPISTGAADGADSVPPVIKVGIGPGGPSGPNVPPSIALTDDALCACTVATHAQLPAVRVLSGSFLAAHPNARFVTLLVDAEPGSTGAAMLTPGDIGVGDQELASLATMCTADQLCAVLRPRLLERLVTDGRGPVLYLDPSVHVLATVDDQILSVISRTPLVLAPKALRPLPDDGLRPTQEELLSAGVYDAGFVAVATGAESFLSSWAAAVRHAPKTAASFLVGAPALVEHHVLRDPGIGLSIWNAAGRQLTKDDTDVMHADGTVLRTVHFSGFDPQRPWLLSAEVAERPRALLSEHPLLAELCATYRGELVRQGGSRQRQAYRFARLEDGTVLPDGLREEYHQAFVDAERTGTDTPPAAFGPQWKGFLRWAAEPVEGLPHSTRWTAALWRDDPALQEQFPDPFAVDATAFREWCAGPGVMSGRVHRDVVPPRADLGAALLDQLGVCVLGTGWMADLVAATARASGVPTSTEPGYPVVLGCGDLTEVPGERYVVAVRIGPCSGADLAGADELWVTSESSRAAHDRVTAIPVRTIALPMLDRPVREDKARASARSANGLANEVVFVTVVDYATERVSNPLGVVSAFLAAFPDRGDVVLLLVVSGFTDNPEAAERLRLATATDPRIRLIEQPTSVPFLIDAADWLVSLHRGDGAGADSIAWWLADTAVRGVPVITSAHGSAVEVFDEETAVLVPCRQGGSEPDIQVAARLLREVAGDPDIADRVARAARWHLLRAYALTRVAEQLREHVEHAYRTWRSRRSAQRPTRDADPLGPLHSARHALLRQPDVGASSKVPMAPALRKAVLRVLSHYDSHLRDVLGTVLDGMERTAAELLNRQEEIRDSGGLGELTNLRAQLDKLGDVQSRLADQFAGTDDAAIRISADLAAQIRRVGELEDVLVTESGKRVKQIDTLTGKLDRLTLMLDKTLDRIDALEAQVTDSLRERDGRLESGIRAAHQALRISDALRGVVVREHERNGDVVDGVRSSLVLCDVGLLRLPAEDALMLPLLSSNGTWQPELSSLIESLVEPDGVFLDIGAHVGYHTIRVLGMLGTGGAVVAVEPCPTTRTLLRHNVAVNLRQEIADRLVLVADAAWDRPGDLVAETAATGGITVFPDHGEPVAVTAAATQAPGNAQVDSSGGAPVLDPEEEALTGELHQTVRGVRLDEELDQAASLKGLRLSVVKVDACGREHRALGGLVRLLRRDRPHVLCSFSPAAIRELGDDPAVVLREFRTWGYDLMSIDGYQPLAPEQVLEELDGNRGTTLWLRPAHKAGEHGVRPADQPI